MDQDGCISMVNGEVNGMVFDESSNIWFNNNWHLWKVSISHIFVNYWLIQSQLT